jgi:hypothetical protein
VKGCRFLQSDSPDDIGHAVSCFMRCVRYQ